MSETYDLQELIKAEVQKVLASLEPTLTVALCKVAQATIDKANEINRDVFSRAGGVQ